MPVCSVIHGESGNASSLAHRFRAVAVAGLSRFSFGELGPRLSKSILEYVILTWSSFLPYKSDGVVYFNTVDEPPARPRAAAARLVALFAFDDKLLSKLLRYDPGRVEPDRVP